MLRVKVEHVQMLSLLKKLLLGVIGATWLCVRFNLDVSMPMANNIFFHVPFASAEPVPCFLTRDCVKDMKIH